MESFKFPDQIDTYLDDHNVLNLSTVGDDGVWSCAVFFANHGRRFFFLSDPNTTHGRHITAGAEVAASIHEDYANWEDIKGVQMKGRCWVVTEGALLKTGLRAYFRKFGFAEEFFRTGQPHELTSRMKNIRLYCLEPELIVWLDNSAGFGKRVTVYPPGDSE